MEIEQSPKSNPLNVFVGYVSEHTRCYKASMKTLLCDSTEQKNDIQIIDWVWVEHQQNIKHIK